LILLALLFIPTVFASKENWTILSKKETVFFNKSLNIRFGYKECHNNPNCMALKILKIVKLDSINRSDKQFGKNLGAVLCKKLSGKVVLGINTQGNQNTFCLFSDNSFVSSGSIYHYARKNSRSTSK
jgi:hypothetical protein